MISNKNRFCFIILLALSINNAVALNSASITADTLAAFPHCSHYRVRGFCNWLSPITGPNTTPYVDYYSPDLVVMVFNKPGDNPWLEANATLDQAGAAAEKAIVSSATGEKAGSGQHSFADVHEQSIYFKEADVIGNPALAVLPPDLVLLPSTAIPFNPYYQSMLDADMWRGLPQKFSIAEETYALGADVAHHVGTYLINWGGIYPHEGKVVSSNDAKAAAVIAQRAADLTTMVNLFSPAHVHQPLGTTCGQECKAAAIAENSDQTQFQLIYPTVQTECDFFGKTILYGNDFEQQTKGAYVWVVWRHYEGCADGDGKYIGKIIH